MGVTLENTRALVEDVGVLNGQEVCLLNAVLKTLPACNPPRLAAWYRFFLHFNFICDPFPVVGVPADAFPRRTAHERVRQHRTSHVRIQPNSTHRSAQLLSAPSWLSQR